jgi:hypothetical protein
MSNTMLIQRLPPGSKCTHNYGFFEWHPCHKPAVAMIWWDTDFARANPLYRQICGDQVCAKHVLERAFMAKRMGARLVEVKP